jgi:hypothetical protein
MHWWLALALLGTLGTVPNNDPQLGTVPRVTCRIRDDQRHRTYTLDHGLEVNIEPDLDPAVDRMTTNGPLTSLDCTVEPQ